MIEFSLSLEQCNHDMATPVDERFFGCAMKTAHRSSSRLSSRVYLVSIPRTPLSIELSISAARGFVLAYFENTSSSQ